jgi:Ca2+-binding RTX toxin-like protein
LIPHRRLCVGLLAALASLIFATSAFAAAGDQTVAYSSGVLTWTGGTNNTPNANDDVVTFVEDGTTPAKVTVHTTSATAIDIVGTPAECSGTGTDTVVCTSVTSVVANADAGADNVDASGLLAVPATLNGDPSVSDGGVDTLTGGAVGDTLNSISGGDTLNGNAGDDTINGGSGADTIDGGDGNDSIYGGAGNDGIDGGAGADYIDGGDDVDTISGGDGGDTIYGGGAGDTINGDGAGDSLYGGLAPSAAGITQQADGADTINGGDGNDYIEGNEGDDLINGNDGADEIYGNDGADTVNGGAGNDYIEGNEGDDILNGGDDTDDIHGGNGNDQIDGGAGDDASYYFIGYTQGGLYGDNGNDTINGGDGIDYADGGSGSDTINGGAGDDSWLNGCYTSNDVTAAANPPGTPHGDLCWGINGGLYGGPGDDTVHGNDGSDWIGGEWSPLSNAKVVVTGLESDNDTLYGDAGGDYMFGGRGADSMDGGTGDDNMQGGDDNDTMSGGDGVDYMTGDNGDDTINGDAGNDAPAQYYDGNLPSGGLYGNDGNDTINGGAGIDFADGGEGNDTIDGGDGNDALQYIACPTAAQKLTKGKGYYYNACTVVYGGVYGGNGDDTLTGGDGMDFVDGADGNDNVDGGPGNDTYDLSQVVQPASYYSDYPGVYGGNGDDVVHGGDGRDYVNGGNGADYSYGDAGDDNLDESDDGSVDVVHGGSGVDHLWYWSCCNSPVNITLDDQADDGEAPDGNPQGDLGDPANNFAADIENVEYDTSCTGDACPYASGSAGADATIVGNSAANLIWGSWGNDNITGGAGADYMSGGYGNDTFNARDGYPDYIDCDDGVDTAIVDQFDTVHNCENVDVANVASAFDTSKPPVPPTPQNPPAQPAAKDTTPPVLTLNSKGTFTAEQLVLGVKVSFSCNEDCALSLRLLAQQAPGSATFSRVKGYNVVVGRKTVGFGKSKRNVKVRPCERKPGGPQSKVCLKRFKAALNARLAKTGKVTMKLYAVTTDRAGNRSTKTKTITIRKKR